MQGNRLMLVIAVVAGVLATVLAFTYINSATSAVEEQEPERQVGVLFVYEPLQANQAIDPDTHLRVGMVGVETSADLVRQAVRAEDRELVRGKSVSSALPAGVPLLYSHLTEVQDLELARGTRAMSIDVDAANLMGGILVPGDRVDIIVSYPRPMEPPDTSGMDSQDPSAAVGAMMSQMMGQVAGGGVPSDWEAEEVLSNIKVIAIGDQLTFSRQAHMFGLAGGGGGGSIVTLEVTPDQAKALIRATAGGGNRLTLLLRPPDTPDGGGGLIQEG